MESGVLTERVGGFAVLKVRGHGRSRLSRRFGGRHPSVLSTYYSVARYAARACWPPRKVVPWDRSGKPPYCSSLPSSLALPPLLRCLQRPLLYIRAPRLEGCCHFQEMTGCVAPSPPRVQQSRVSPSQQTRSSSRLLPMAVKGTVQLTVASGHVCRSRMLFNWPDRLCRSKLVREGEWAAGVSCKAAPAHLMVLEAGGHLLSGCRDHPTQLHSWWQPAVGVGTVSLQEVTQGHPAPTRHRWGRALAVGRVSGVPGARPVPAA